MKTSLTEEVLGTGANPSTLRAPNGLEIKGTLERLAGVSCLVSLAIKDGKLIYEYDGETEVYWEEQETVQRDGEPVFVDVEGGEWTTRQLLDQAVAPAPI